MYEDLGRSNVRVNFYTDLFDMYKTITIQTNQREVLIDITAQNSGAPRFVLSTMKH